MGLVEVSLLAEELPGRFGLVRDDRGLGKLGTHLNNLVLKALVLIIDVSYQADVVVVEGTFLLELEPLLLEDVKGLRHRELLQKVADEVIDHHLLLQDLRLSFRLVCLHRGHITGHPGL